MRNSYLIASLAVAAAVILGLTFYLRQAEPESAPTVVEEEPLLDAAPNFQSDTSSELRSLMEDTPPSPVIDEPVLELPALDQSDEFVRERLPRALPEDWVAKEDLLRRVAVVVDNANRGEIPKRQLEFMAPQGVYQVREVLREGQSEPELYVDPESFSRYDGYLDLLEAWPAGDLGRLIRDTDPLLDQAMAELGSQEPLVPQVLTIIDQILAVPLLPDEVELLQPKVLYEYADPALEGLSDLQKQVLRMGPDNVARLQRYLTDVRADLIRNQTP